VVVLCKPESKLFLVVYQVHRFIASKDSSYHLNLSLLYKAKPVKPGYDIWSDPYAFRALRCHPNPSETNSSSVAINLKKVI
jgi:hypothetical protein